MNKLYKLILTLYPFYVGATGFILCVYFFYDKGSEFINSTEAGFYSITLIIASLIIIFYNFLRPEKYKMNNLEEDVLEEKKDKENETLKDVSIVSEPMNGYDPIENKYGKAYIYKKLSQPRLRIKKEIKMLNDRAILNLILGSIITVVALILLGIFISNENFNEDNIINVILRFVPKLSLVIFIEIFAFFFLKIYRDHLNDIKYYQNELTSIETTQLALITALNHGDENDIHTIVSNFSNMNNNIEFLSNKKGSNNQYYEIMKSCLDILAKNKSD